MSNDGDEKKVTEELLSGFDRPGRTPRTPRVRSRDFVDYYSGRDAAKVDASPPASRREDTKAHEKPTVIVPRRNNVRATMTWVVAVVGMILFGATIAVLSTPQTPPSSSAMLPPTPSAPPTTPTSATTITSAIPAEPEPEPTQESVNAPPPTKKALPTTTITSGASSAPTIKTAPRDDFIRDL